MDFNVYDASFDSMIMHQIHAKSSTADFGSVTLSENIIPLNEQVVETLRKRIANALSTGSRAFEASIADVSEGSFYTHSTRLWSSNTQGFINTSQLIAQKLAESLNRSIIPGGYLLVIKGELQTHPFTIVIKAEMHEALIEKKSAGVSSIELIEKIFLSPSNKFYKIGLIYNIPNPTVETPGPNQENCCLLFDDNSNVIGEPAEYFYKDFLGFDPSNDARLKTKLFYNRITGFINEDVSENDLKRNLNNAIETLFHIDQTDHIDPTEFRDRYIPGGPEFDKFSSKVLIHFPRPFKKDVALIEKSIAKKKITFGKIKVEGPVDEFNRRINVLSNDDIRDLQEEQLNGFTIIKIQGSPYGD